eukprot:TRINITY_DN10291_c0_g1_i1.p3 TRINITY_DN10291_c0_g1~~TRINITY_DN10291_c0_g1_i1.p3  ORF type:complete len:51 (+),score=7.23 TRINITY_DN10291_c0_g1_i1:500-652(+)
MTVEKWREAQQQEIVNTNDSPTLNNPKSSQNKLHLRIKSEVCHLAIFWGV